MKRADAGTHSIRLHLPGFDYCVVNFPEPLLHFVEVNIEAISSSILMILAASLESRAIEICVGILYDPADVLQFSQGELEHNFFELARPAVDPHGLNQIRPC